MRLTFVVPCSRWPIGGAIASYHLANAMRRRAHDVQIVHIDIIGDPRHHVWRLPDPVRSIDDLGWMRFEPEIVHEFPERFDERALPRADVVFFYGEQVPPRCGLPVIPVQGQGVSARPTEERLFFAPCPKLCTGQWLVRTLSEMGVPRRQLVYVPNGIDHGVFRVLVPVERRPHRVVMQYSSNPIKGSREGLAALVRAKERVPDMSATVFGREERPSSLPDWVNYLRRPTPEEIAGTVYNDSTVFLWPSLSEGFGLPPVEAMACETAVVTTANGGSAEYAIHGETALVCQPGDDRAMASALETLLRDDALRISLATRGREYVQRFDWDASAGKLERFLGRYRANPDYYRARPTTKPDYAGQSADD
jgi:glycosyltransferase involved in cell wall biosynthesis